MAWNIEPQDEWCEVAPVTTSAVTDAGIVLPQQEAHILAQVVAVGPGGIVPRTGERVTPACKVGDHVLFLGEAQHFVDGSGTPHYFVRSSAVVAIVRGVDGSKRVDPKALARGDEPRIVVPS